MFHILKSSSFKSPYTSNEDLLPLGILWPKRYVKSWTESSVCRGNHWAGTVLSLGRAVFSLTRRFWTCEGSLGFGGCRNYPCSQGADPVHCGKGPHIQMKGSDWVAWGRAISFHGLLLSESFWSNTTLRKIGNHKIDLIWGTLGGDHMDQVYIDLGTMTWQKSILEIKMPGCMP